MGMREIECKFMRRVGNVERLMAQDVLTAHGSVTEVCDALSRLHNRKHFFLAWLYISNVCNNLGNSDVVDRYPEQFCQNRLPGDFIFRLPGVCFPSTFIDGCVAAVYSFDGFS